MSRNRSIFFTGGGAFNGRNSIDQVARNLANDAKIPNVSIIPEQGTFDITAPDKLYNTFDGRIYYRDDSGAQPVYRFGSNQQSGTLDELVSQNTDAILVNATSLSDLNTSQVAQDSRMDNIVADVESNNTNISSLNAGQSAQDIRMDNLVGEIESNDNDIANLNAEQTAQDALIAENADEISIVSESLADKTQYSFIEPTIDAGFGSEDWRRFSESVSFTASDFSISSVFNGTAGYAYPSGSFPMSGSSSAGAISSTQFNDIASSKLNRITRVTTLPTAPFASNAPNHLLKLPEAEFYYFKDATEGYLPISSSGVASASGLSVDNSLFKVLTGDNSQDLWNENDTALLNARTTGIRYGAVSSVNPSLTGVDITAGEGQILDNTDPENPTFIQISWTAKTDIQHIGGDGLSYWYFDANDDTVKQTTTLPSPADRRTRAYFLLTSFSGGVISGFSSRVVPVQQEGQSIKDLADALGIFKTGGFQVSPSGANLRLKVASGTLFEYGSNWANSAVNPHISTESAFDSGAGGFFRYTTSTTLDPTDFTDLDVANYAPNGVVTAIPGNFVQDRFGIHIIFEFPGGNVRAARGDEFYTNIDDAIAGLGIINPLDLAVDGFENAIVLGAIIAEKDVTDFEQGVIDGDVVYVQTNAFGSFAGGIISSIAGSFLEVSNNLSDLGDLVAAKANLNYLASEIPLDTTGFDNNLSTSDINLQALAQTVNDLDLSSSLSEDWNEVGAVGKEPFQNSWTFFDATRELRYRLNNGYIQFSGAVKDGTTIGAIITTLTDSKYHPTGNRTAISTSDSGFTVLFLNTVGELRIIDGGDTARTFMDVQFPL